MKDMIRRYVFDVTRRLPEAMRADVDKELNANILDMLPQNPTDDDIRKVLVGLGEPRELAAGYRGTQRSLISAKWMDEYIRVLRIVLVIFGTISLVFGLIEHITDVEATNVLGAIGEIVGGILADVIASLFRAFTIVTLVFAGIDYYGAKVKKEPWSPDCLPELPKENVKRISRTESIIGIILSAVFGAVWIYILNLNQLYIGWYDNGGFGSVVTPLFNDAIIRVFIPLYVIEIFFAIGEHLVNLRVGHWNLATAVTHTVAKVFSIALFIAFVRQPDLLNAAFLDRASVFFDLPSAQIAENIAGAAIGISTLIAIVTVIDLIATWVKALRIPSRPDVK